MYTYKIDRIKRMVQRFTENPSIYQLEYQVYLAKCSRLFELLLQLNELEELEPTSYDEESTHQIFNEQVRSIGEEVRNVICK